ncbi:protein kinase [Streptomyces sp. NBC_00876]|uniref:protein kinase domain-containing protein n=1 Tax=Streptomyces sp. NBC_00876 TaxID=2975853 RepID=UPI00386984B1|nr:protein kinase [Streptomyces sp. NBC_00876]
MGGDERGEREDYVAGGIKPLTEFDPARIGPYLLLGRLGAGGMGRVFLARSDSGRTVAVKVVHEEHASDARFRARFRREIEAAGRVAERFTAPVLDAGPDDDPPWVATGYVPGLSLERIVRQHGPLPAASLYALTDGLLHALKDIHDAGIVHRDLKPSNVMLTVDGTKVIDFGIARALETSVESLLTSTGMAIGSPGFMSPEQIRGEAAGPKSDVFTLGCVLMYAATGRLPFGHGASNAHVVMYRIVQEEPDLEGVEDEAFKSLIARCLIKDEKQRPGVDALLADTGGSEPAASQGAWLPPDVVAHLARQAAQLLDAEVRPLREEPVDRATADLRPKAAPPVAPGLAPQGNAGKPVAPGLAPQADPPVAPDLAPKGKGSAAEPGGRRPRRRRTVIALPVVLVLTVGGATMVVLQPGFGDAEGARPPASSASPAADGSNSPGKPGSSPSKKEKEKGKEDGKGSGGTGGSSGTPAEPSRSATTNGGGSTGSGGSSTGAPTGSSGSATGSSGSATGSSGSPTGPTGSGGGGSSGAASAPADSPPPAVKGFKVEYTSDCAGPCSRPIKVSWSSADRASGYDIHYTNKGSSLMNKNVDTNYHTGGTSFPIGGTYSRDEICFSVRATNRYGDSAWSEPWCGTVPY